jgi:hypothetical protein
MPYTEPLKIGAVYQSRAIPDLSRRVTRLRNGVVDYVLHLDGEPHSECGMMEYLFRDMTAREIPPAEL